MSSSPLNTIEPAFHPIAKPAIDTCQQRRAGIVLYHVNAQQTCLLGRESESSGSVEKREYFGGPIGASLHVGIDRALWAFRNSR